MSNTDNKTTFIMKRSAAGQVNKKLMEYFNKIPLEIDEAQSAMVHYFVDEDVIDTWTQVLDKLRVKYREDELGIYLPEKLRREFLRYLNIQASKLFSETFDTTSRLLVRGATDMDNELNWFLKWPDCMLSNFKETGCYGCIEGVPRAGKTSVSCTFMPILHDTFGLDIITNVAVGETDEENHLIEGTTPDYIHIVKKLSDLLKEMSELKRWICILDETATFAYKKNALSTANIDFENLARFIGKMGGSLLMITHSFEKDVPTQLQTWMTERFKKLGHERMKVDLEGLNYKAHMNVCGIPDSVLPFSTNDITSLDFDISIKRVLERVQSGISIESAVNEQLKEKEPDNPDNKPERTIINGFELDKINLYIYDHPDETGTSVAKKFNITSSAVTQRKKTMRKHGIKVS